MLSSYQSGLNGRMVADGLDPGQRADGASGNGSTVASRRRSARTALPQLSAEARNLNWLVGNFAKNTSGVAHAMVVSADGLPIAVSDHLERARADQLAATASCLASLSQGGARCFDGGLVKQTVVEMEPGFLFVTSISDGSCLTVLAASSCDVGVVAYQMAMLVTRVGDVLTPACGPSSKPPSRHERPTSGWRQVSYRRRSRAPCPGGKPPACKPGMLDRPR
jgi:uncharacterized protein